MSFEQMDQRYRQLEAEYLAGRLDAGLFQTELDGMVVQDGLGTWWQIVYGGNWYYWNGAIWTPGVPGMPKVLAGDKSTGVLTGVARQLAPLAGHSEKWWNLVSIVGGGMGGALWYVYSSLDRGASADPVTSWIMLLFPVCLIFLRRPIDRMIAPFLPLRRLIPRLVLIGAGIASPFFIASFLYNQLNISNYPLVRWSVFLGSLTSYLIIRTPNPAHLTPRSGIDPAVGRQGPFQDTPWR